MSSDWFPPSSIFKIKVKVLRFGPIRPENLAILIHFRFLCRHSWMWLLKVNTVNEVLVSVVFVLVLGEQRPLSPDRYLLGSSLLDLASVELPIMISLNFREQLPPNCAKRIKNHGRQTQARQCLNIYQVFLNRRAVGEERACLTWPDDVLLALWKGGKINTRARPRRQQKARASVMPRLPWQPNWTVQCWDWIIFWIIKERKKRAKRGSRGFSGLSWVMLLPGLCRTFNPVFGLRSKMRSRLVTHIRNLFKDATLEYVTASTASSRAGRCTFGNACMPWALYRFCTDRTFEIYWVRECGTSVILMV